MPKSQKYLFSHVWMDQMLGKNLKNPKFDPAGLQMVKCCFCNTSCFASSMSFPVAHSHAFAHGTVPQVRRKPTSALHSSCNSQRSVAAQHQLNFSSSLRGQELGCRQLPSRCERTALHAVARQAGGDNRREEASDGFQERVVQVRRVTKVVKGGKQLSFR